MVKRVVFAAMYVFWAVIVAILAAGFFFVGNNGAPAVPQTSTTLVAGGSGNPTNGGVNTLVLSASEIAKHSTSSSCWMIISGNVYDFTSYLGQHPGRASTMIGYCGKDGTVGFQTKDMGSPHSSFASSLLSQYYLGGFGLTVQVAGAGQPSVGGGNPASSLPTSIGRIDDTTDD
jgi:cytochrome b involved in lipid metabolism